MRNQFQKQKSEILFSIKTEIQQKIYQNLAIKLLSQCQLVKKDQVSFSLQISYIQKGSLTAQKNQQYSDLAMQHALHPKNVGVFKDKKDVGTGVVGNPQCGDVMKLSLKIQNGKIVDAKFKTFGCGAAVASSSYATELVKGKTIKEAKEICNTDISKKLSLPPVKLHCSLLAEEAIKAAIDDYEKQHKHQK